MQRTIIDGWINLNKPLGMTSAQAVNKVKWLLKPAKIGHAGTLDPLATGILPLALGKATKLVSQMMDARKIYEFRIVFGEARATDDAEGEVVATSPVIPTEQEIQAVLPRFMGEITQIPPMYSAIKIDGKRAYDLARAGAVVEMKPRQVMVYGLELLNHLPNPNPESLPCAHFRAEVGKGTYIRSLGRDIAQALGSVGYIGRLHRTAVGPFCDKNAISLDFLEKSVHNPAPVGGPPIVLPLNALLDGIPASAA